MSRPAVLVTGAARRIGAVIARTFGEAGWHVILHYHHSRTAAEALAASLPSAQTIGCELEDGDAALRMVEALAAMTDDWRCLVNNAALFHKDKATRLEPAVAGEALQVNAITPARLAQSFLAHARSATDRCVIQLTDQKLANPNPDFFSYTMSKHAVASIVPMLAMAHPADRIYALAPGAILASYDQDEAEAERSHRLNLLARRTSAEEVARAALFLARGPLASGQVLHVDSGQHLLAQKRDVMYLAREGEMP